MRRTTLASVIKAPCEEASIRSEAEGHTCRHTPWVLAATILGSSLTFIDGTVVGVALPVLQRELGAGMTEAQWVVESYSLMLSSLILLGGALGDRKGRRRVFSAGVVLFAAASAACGLAGGAGQLIAARAVQGVGAALLVPGSLAILSASFPEDERGRAIGTWSGFTSVAAGIGPVLGGWLVEHASWRWVFFVNLPLAAVVLALTWWRVPESRGETAQGGVDMLGAAAATLGLGGVVYGLVESGARGFGDPRVAASLVSGVALLAAFFFVERRRGARAMVPLSLFRSRTFAGANLLTLCLYGGLGGLLFFLPFDLIQVRGYSATEAGAALVPFVLTMFLLSRWAGGLVGRYGARPPLVAGPVIAAAGFALFMLPGVHAGSYWTSFFPAVVLLSLGMATTVAPLTTTVMNAVGERHAGVASGINNAVARTAGLVAVAVLGVVVTGVFARRFNSRLAALSLPDAARAELSSQAGRLAAIETPAGLSDDARLAVVRAVEESFEGGFRTVVLVCAALSLSGALGAWLLIEDNAPPADGRAQE